MALRCCRDAAGVASDRPLQLPGMRLRGVGKQQCVERVWFLRVVPLAAVVCARMRGQPVNVL